MNLLAGAEKAPPDPDLVWRLRSGYRPSKTYASRRDRPSSKATAGSRRKACSGVRRHPLDQGYREWRGRGGGFSGSKTVPNNLSKSSTFIRRTLLAPKGQHLLAQGCKPWDQIPLDSRPRSGSHLSSDATHFGVGECADQPSQGLQPWARRGNPFGVSRTVKEP